MTTTITIEEQMREAFAYGFSTMLSQGGLSEDYLADLSQAVQARWPGVELLSLVDMLTRFDVALRCPLCNHLAKPNPFLTPHRLGEGEPSQVTFFCSCATTTKATTTPAPIPVVNGSVELKAKKVRKGN